MKILLNKELFRELQVVAAVLFFLFCAGNVHAGHTVEHTNFLEMVESNRPLNEVILYGLDYGMTLQSLVDELVAANKDGSAIICGLFMAGVDRSKAVEAALKAGLDHDDVAQWSLDCGATMEDVQMGFSMAGEKLPPGFVFNKANEFEDSDKEYLYNPPSPTQ